MSVSCKKEPIKQPDSINSSLSEVTHVLLDQCFLTHLRQLFKKDFVLVSLGCHEEYWLFFPHGVEAHVFIGF